MGKIRTLEFAEGVSVASPTESGGTKTLSNESYTITDTDGYHTIIMGGTISAHRTVTLPSASTNKGRIIRFCRSASWVSGNYYYGISGTISGGTTNNVFYGAGGTAAVVSDGSSWHWVQDIAEQVTWSSNCVLYEGATPLAVATTSAVYNRSGRIVVAKYTFDNITKAGSGNLSTTLPFTISGVTPPGAVLSDYLTFVTVPSALPSGSTLFFIELVSGGSYTNLTASDLHASNITDIRASLTFNIAR